MSQNPSRFQNPNVEKYFNELQGKTFIQEKGFDPSTVLCKEIRPFVRYHKWEHFWTIPKNHAVVLVVQEFYASLRDQESRNSEGQLWDIVPM
ncbi:hypothetical protein Godav_024402 [Gossypium davidsonii]|uniref:Uncharacterized protein n=2 Tax=Gossypium TaxID=3633 RepID=A0A7J8T9P4_GOSDV|nr:hypothetical protein [Gossypium davidsonii]MBA0670574.1 hypothetical protein [Gossypium klotzschianum]